ncbi:hypothetical protein CSPAE12_11522 [Colletotrichum incanum]|nr:hypothetical protein CSPAE12_11522 [Colletotrichum incanum]
MSTTRQPTERDCAWFYYGLPSQPRLIARSSSTSYRFGFDGWSSEPKTLTIVGKHDIVGKWNDEPSSLRKEVLDTLAEKKVDWQAVDIVRIGYVGEEMPVILSISVVPGTLSWVVGDQVAGQCRNALLDHGLDDVHCEIKESRLVNLASAPAVLQQDRHDHPLRWYSYIYQLSDQLSTSIASLDQPHREGTKGIHLRRAGGESGEVLVLTCRHVCYGEREKGSRLPEEETLPSKSIIQLPGKTRDNLVVGLKSFNVRRARRSKQKKRRERPATRDYGVQDPGFLSDWCLVQLEARCHERHLSELSNRVYIDGDDFDQRFPVRDTAVDVVQDRHHDRTIQVGGIVAVSELLDTSRTHIVGMRGQKSGLRFGLFNQVKSVVRRVYSDGPTFLSRECCVVADSADSSSIFTKKGDSGACVFDLEGRAVGMVTAGIERGDLLQGNDDYGLDRAVDVTYVTPMEWLLADMKACGLSMEIF